MKSELEIQYLKLSEQISRIDKKIIDTNDPGELLALIELRKPLGDQSIDLYKRILDEGLKI